jgi:hypothetical protein
MYVSPFTKKNNVPNFGYNDFGSPQAYHEDFVFIIRNNITFTYTTFVRVFTIQCSIPQATQHELRPITSKKTSTGNSQLWPPHGG